MVHRLVCQCARENRLNRSQLETLRNLYPVREAYFPDPVIFLAGFGMVLNQFSWDPPPLLLRFYNLHSFYFIYE